MINNKIVRTEIHYIKNNEELFETCNKSKLLYNSALYLSRQHYFEHKNDENTLKTFLWYNNMYKLLKNSDQYKALPAQTSQAIIKMVDRNWKSYRKSIKVYWQDRSKFKSIPRIPKYKRTDYQTVIYPGQNITIRKRDGKIKIPKSRIEFKPYNVTRNDKLLELRIVPVNNKIKVEIIYEKEIRINNNLNKDRILGIDLGLNNLMAITSNQEGIPSCLINGRPLKSINQNFNKKLSKFKAELDKCQPKQYRSRRINGLYFKRKMKIKDYLHKASRYIVNYCKELEIGTIVVGKNDGWKQKINIGKRNNQKFVQVPFNKLIEMIQYKAEELGIDVMLTEESYTSKIDHLSFEELGKHKIYLGKRKKRGLFQSNIGKLINADINGAIGILRKVVGDSFIEEISNRGLVYSPFKISLV